MDVRRGGDADGFQEVPEAAVALGGPIGHVGPVWRLAVQERHVLIIASGANRARMLRRLLERWGERVTIRGPASGRLLVRALTFDGVAILAGEHAPLAGVPEGSGPDSLRAEAARAGIRLAGRWLNEPRTALSLERVYFGPLSFELKTAALVDGLRRVRLTSLEAHLLRVLALNAHTPVPKAALRPDIEKGRAVDIAIMRLRRRIEPNPAEPIYLRTVRCRGYMLKPDHLERGMGE